ncbi:hypothetical protein K438DRAFT_1108959 [Mycena galopus ATCC 62051]|nr:hypothetical protein K438DRAFT_1108959 [Mycena galopus ATCC 62051]
MRLSNSSLDYPICHFLVVDLWPWLNKISPLFTFFKTSSKMRYLWLTTVLSLFQLASATVQNITVDDQNGGPDGTSITYQPAGAWVQGAIGGCSDCPPPPISSQAFMNTFHGSLFNQNNSKRIQNPPFATLVFVGSSVSVNCILSNALSDPVGISQ